MLKLWKPAASSHEDLFIERYERLLAWSLKLTGHDRQLAEDLLHDTFVQFTLHRPDLTAIHDLEGYLFAMLRNSHLSHVRRAPNVRTTSLSMVEFDSIEVGLRVTDVQDQIKVQDELRLICHYSTLRKETSKSGSVLILRFFHGYYPSEIAEVLRSNWQTVGKWLQLARSEARLYLEDPQALGFIKNSSAEPKPQLGFARTTEDLLGELRQMICSSRRGDCLSQKQLREAYQSSETTAINGALLAHIVSCPPCLDRVNQLLGLSLLHERYPTDMTGRDTKGGSGGGPTATGGTGNGIKRSLRRVKETFEHRPKELRIAVNGHIQVSQKVSADRMEQTLSLDLEEKPGFVEIFSEQWIRLFFLNIEPPPDGAFEQRGHIALSEGRSLEATLNFSGPCPNLQVIYHDPTLISAESDVLSPESEVESKTIDGTEPKVPDVQGEQNGLRALCCKWIDSRLRTSDWRLFLRPGTVTALFALILIAALVLYLRVPTPPVSASELLSRAAIAEESITAKTDQVIHRTISLEEKSSNGTLLARRRIEIWRSAEKGITARRLFDDRGALIAGDWRRSDGVQTLYHHGARPQLQSVPEKRAATPISFDAVWQLDPSAKQFAQLIGNTGTAQVESLASTYVISYASKTSTGLIRGTLVLSRDDLRAIEQTLVIAQGNEVREYRFTEASFEHHSPATVAPAVFDPDPELISARPNNRIPTPDTSAVAAGPQPPTPIVATAELEVEVLRLLNQVGADLNDQTSVTRTSDGKLRIGGLVDTDQRKSEIVRALAPVSSSPAVQIQIETVAEAVRHQTRPRTSPAQTAVERVEIGQARIAAYEDLRKYFGKDDREADEQIRQFASRMLSRSSQAMSHAGTMRRLARQFSQEDLRTMSPEAKAKWISVIKAHARAFEQESKRLRQELQPIFFPGASTEQAPIGIEITDDASLIRAVERLFEQGSANDDVIRSAFAVTSETIKTSAIKTPQFWRSLVSAEALAAHISRQ